MSRMRVRLRLWTIAWLLCYVGSYSALIPRDCCASHAHRPKPVEKAIEVAGNATCALHHALPEPEPSPRSACSWRGTCGGPMAALASFLSNNGVLPNSVDITFDSSLRAFASYPRERVASLSVAPDPRPPRA